MLTPLVHVCAFTHRGRVRTRNEDTVAIGSWISPPEMAAPHVIRQPLASPLLCAVADGMGGHRAGDVASRHATFRLAQAGAALVTAQRVRETLARIDGELQEASAKDASLAGMGTTVAGIVLGRPLLRFNVGDSRLYRCDGGLMQVSIDDTPPGPRRGLLTQSLGGGGPGRPLRPHVAEEALAVPARFLLCSDGLTDMIGEADIADCLTLPDEEAVLQLFDRAMAAGGTDNVSIVVVRLEEGG